MRLCVVHIINVIYDFIIELNNGFGSVVVAIITLLGTWGINKYNNNKSYEIAYKKILINKQLKTIEDMYKFLQNFMTVIEPDGWFPWMVDFRKLDLILKDLDTIERELLWFPNDIRNMIISLGNELNNYRSSSLIHNIDMHDEEASQQRNKYRDEYTNRLIKKRNAIEIKLYDLLIHPNHMKKILDENKKTLEGIPWMKK